MLMVVQLVSVPHSSPPFISSTHPTAPAPSPPQARGKSGPLFDFGVHEDLRVVNDASREKNESHAGKVVERHWYDRNKHIFPASRWEVRGWGRGRGCVLGWGVGWRVRLVWQAFRAARGQMKGLGGRLSGCVCGRLSGCVCACVCVGWDRYDLGVGYCVPDILSRMRVAAVLFVGKVSMIVSGALCHNMY